jgi:hypothetical protein
MRLLEGNLGFLSRLAHRNDKRTPWQRLHDQMRQFVKDLWFDYEYPNWRDEEDE